MVNIKKNLHFAYCRWIMDILCSLPEDVKINNG